MKLLSKPNRDIPYFSYSYVPPPPTKKNLNSNKKPW